MIDQQISYERGWISLSREHFTVSCSAILFKVSTFIAMGDLMNVI